MATTRLKIGNRVRIISGFAKGYEGNVTQRNVHAVSRTGKLKRYAYAVKVDGMGIFAFRNKQLRKIGKQ